MTNTLRTLLLVGMLLCWPAHAQDAEQADHASAAAVITDLRDRIGTQIMGYFASLEALAADENLIKAIKDDDTEQLQELASSYKDRLEGSLKVRVFVRNQEQPDSLNSPACGFACIEIARSAYDGKPPAEALLFRSADANLTLARGIIDQNSEAIGALVAHYPFSLLKNEIAKLTIPSMYTELRQTVNGPAVVLFSHGDRTVKQGTAQKLLRIPESKWVVATWTPGGVAVEEYIEPELPWMYIIMGIVVLIVGIAILVIYRIKHPVEKKTAPSKYTEALSAEAISFDHEHESKTLILGGGADEVDVSKYLRDEDITNLKQKSDEDITSIKLKSKKK